MNLVLLILLFFIMIYIDKERGIKLFLSLIFQFIILIILFTLLSIGFNPIICSFLGCLVVSSILLFYVNGKNVKTISSYQSILIVLIGITFLIIWITNIARIAGFGVESLEEINMFSFDVRIDFTNIIISVILISLVGAMIDTSIAISSSLYEVYENNKELSKKELFQSGMNIGEDILCTTTNTLLFAFLGEFMTLVIWYYTSNYSFLDMINAKTFASEIIKILFSAIGCFMIIPVTSYITTYSIQKKEGK